MFDLMIIGQMTLDHNIDYDGREEYSAGGAVTFSGYAAAAIGHSVAVVPKGNPEKLDPYKVFADSKVKKIFPVISDTCTEMENRYFTADRERRRCLNTEMISPYTPEDGTVHALITWLSCTDHVTAHALMTWLFGH